MWNLGLVDFWVFGSFLTGVLSITSLGGESSGLLALTDLVGGSTI